jgi:uncharacterized protein
VVSVNEAGASVYSASDLAREEFPDLDLTIRGAISIARRLQDPLAELVKVEPKAIGVGQYQHDVHQPLLGKKLDDVVESCVNHVGVELNTASAPLLQHVAGIGPALAKQDRQAPRRARRVRLQAGAAGRARPRAQGVRAGAGFLRIRGGDHPLDASRSTPSATTWSSRSRATSGDVGGAGRQRGAGGDKIDLASYVGGDVGEPTLRDIVAELARARAAIRARSSSRRNSATT